jgi:copper chaperone CopZ
VAVKRALEGLEGVSRADVSFRDKRARVTFDPAKVSVEQLIEAVNRLGFRASLKRQGE